MIQGIDHSCWVLIHMHERGVPVRIPSRRRSTKPRARKFGLGALLQKLCARRHATEHSPGVNALGSVEPVANR